MKDLEERVLKAVEDQSDLLLNFLSELIRAKSITGQEGEAQGIVADKLSQIGLTVDKWEPSKHDFGNFNSFVSEEKTFSGRLNIVGKIKGSENEKPLALNGHIDVVPAGREELWKYGPWSGEVHNGRIFGRGACDMKSGLCAIIFATKAILEAVVSLRRDVLVESVIGEENGGVGTLSTILRGYKPSATIIAEPTQLKILAAQCGCLMFRLFVEGKAAHGALRDSGVSAVEKFQPLFKALLRLEMRRNKARNHPLYHSIENRVPLSIGLVRAGNWDSTVPEELVAEGRYGVWPGESLDEARTQFEQAIKDESSRDGWLSKHPPKIEWFGPQWESAEIPKDHKLVGLVANAYSKIEGSPPKIEGATYGSDMRLFTNVARTPALLFGPGDVKEAHFRDESVRVEELIKACKVYALSILEWNAA